MNLAVYVHPGWGQLPVALKWLSLQLVCNTVITQLAKSDSVWFYSACKLKSSTPRVTKSAGQSLLVFHLRHFSKVKNVFLSCFHIVMERKEIYFKGSVSTAGSRFFFKKKKAEVSQKWRTAETSFLTCGLDRSLLLYSSWLDGQAGSAEARERGKKASPPSPLSTHPSPL